MIKQKWRKGEILMLDDKKFRVVDLFSDGRKSILCLLRVDGGMMLNLTDDRRCKKLSSGDDLQLSLVFCMTWLI